MDIEDNTRYTVTFTHPFNTLAQLNISLDADQYDIWLPVFKEFDGVIKEMQLDSMK